MVTLSKDQIIKETDKWGLVNGLGTKKRIGHGFAARQKEQLFLFLTKKEEYIALNLVHYPFTDRMSVVGLDGGWGESCMVLRPPGLYVLVAGQWAVANRDSTVPCNACEKDDETMKQLIVEGLICKSQDSLLYHRRWQTVGRNSFSRFLRGLLV